MNAAQLYNLVDLSKKAITKQEVVVSEDSQASSRTAMKLAEGMREHQKGQKLQESAPSAPIKPYLYS